MKIAFIVGCFPILSETFILNQIIGLLDRGHQVDIYADQKGDTIKVHEAIEKYSLLDHTYYFPEIPQNLLLRVVKSLPLLVSYGYRDPASVVHSLNFFKYGKQSLSLWLLYTIVPNLSKSYDIIHCQFGSLAFRAMAFQKQNAPQAKLITIFRGHDISRFVKENGKQIYNELFKTGDFFLANCQFFRSHAVNLGCDPNKIIVHYSGLDSSKFPFDSRQFPTDGKVRIATTGRLVEKKGIEYAIRAVAQQAETHPNIEYNIIGDGELKPHLQQLIDELKVGHIVHLLGWKNEQEIIEILQRSHLFIAPSVTAADGNQDAPINVLKEAMAMGLPVVSTYHGGIPELVEEGVSGFLVPERDADALAQKLGYLLDHSETWAEMGQSGRAFVEQHYDLHKLNDRLVTVYEQLLATDSGSLACTPQPIGPNLFLNNT
ncbi:MAG: glycosyltransferase [Cyanophyceae cyanobacterium]